MLDKPLKKEKKMAQMRWVLRHPRNPECKFSFHVVRAKAMRFASRERQNALSTCATVTYKMIRSIEVVHAKTTRMIDYKMVLLALLLLFCAFVLRLVRICV